jgi:hypothetical protein
MLKEVGLQHSVTPSIHSNVIYTVNMNQYEISRKANGTDHTTVLRLSYITMYVEFSFLRQCNYTTSPKYTISLACVSDGKYWTRQIKQAWKSAFKKDFRSPRFFENPF